MRKELENIIRLLEKEIGFYYPGSDPTFRKCMQTAQESMDKIIFDVLNQEGSDGQAKNPD